MSLTNQQYNELTREYERQRLKNIHELDERTHEVYQKLPEIQKINEEMAHLSVATAKERLLSKTGSTQSTTDKLHTLIAKKKALLTKHGYPEDYLAMHYRCERCQDSGYEGNEICSCMRKKIISILYEQSNIKELLEKENFSQFQEELYPENLTDNSGISAKQNILNILNICHDFVDNYSTDYNNLFIFGAAGVGKTFLINCIAKELIDRSYSVIYMSSIQFFKILGDASFHKNENLNENENRVYRDFHECDLLIIDDLGTEVANTFTASALFHCLNERFIRRKPIIISTNLTLASLRDLYSDRVFSRIASNYKMLKIFGNDLRIMKTLH